MTHLQALNPETATGKTKDLFNAVQNELGMVPNMMRTMGNSYAVLNGYLSFSAALGESKIGAKLGELIALVVAETNRCEYCAAAHTFFANLLGIDNNTILGSRIAETGDAKTDAALVFARALVNKKGSADDSDVDAVRGAGYTEGEIAEIIAHVALNIFTNYFNKTAKTPVDFPGVELYGKAAA